jgi:serine/threonine protein kinase/tetratricopeptide (TPR) repeat protein
MGEVYAAYDHELDRKVAVKLLRVKPGNGVSFAEGRQRTLREAQAIARLSHPNVVVVYDVGTFEDQVFIAMEFVDGNTVTYWLQSHQRTWQDILKVFMAAGRGLTAAHDKELVHRDFKPDNVMVGRDGSVRVMDFGLARQVDKVERGPDTVRHLNRALFDPSATFKEDEGLSTLVINNAADQGMDTQDLASHSAAFDTQLTRTGAMMGTPAYMAPEQFLGTATDARTDQFSFCVALYEALYSERPFAGNSMFQLTANVVQGNVKEAPEGAKVPPWVRRILLRGLRPNAEERFPSMKGLLDALEKDPAVAWRRRAMTVAAVLLPLAVGLGVRQSLASRTQSPCGGGLERLAGVWEPPSANGVETPRQAAIHHAFLATKKAYAADVFASVTRVLGSYAQGWAHMYKESCEATQVRGEQSAEVLDLRMSCLQERLGGLRALTHVFSEANGEVVENAVSAANALAPLDRCADVPLLRAVVRPPEDPSTRARVGDLRRRLAELKARSDAGRWRDSIHEGEELLREARNVGYRPLIAETLMVLGFNQLKITDSIAGEASLQEAFWQADASRDDDVRADAATSLVWDYGYLQSKFKEADRWATMSEAVLTRLGGHDLQRAWLLNNKGGVDEVQGHKEEALRAHEEALALKTRAWGSADHPDVGLSEGNIAVVLQDLGRYQEALAHVDRAVTIATQGLGAEHPDLAVQMSNRGEILNLLGRYREARQSFERARIIWERELGLEARNLAYALTGIGESYLAEGDAVSAVVPLERAWKIRAAKEADPERRGETLFALARALWDSERDRLRAEALAHEARDAYGKTEVKAKLAEVDAWLARRKKS